MHSALPSLDPVRYEVLPFGTAEEEARAVGEPLTLTVTCSPRQGIDHSVDVGRRLRELGHGVVVHLAARMVRDQQHLDDLLARMADAGIGDVFLVGGDASPPAGPYASALDLLPELRAHRLAPRSIGVAAYPEGHPLIEPNVLSDALRQKDGVADYMCSQLCFDADVVLAWLRQTREAGVRLPLYVGLPGMVDRRRLLEISMRVGVGASLSFVRKQRGLRRLFTKRLAATERLHDAIAPLVGGELGIAGMHFFTFNRLSETVRFAAQRQIGQTVGITASRPIPTGAATHL
jgi:methylenetetrahydrofolate reductase (NADPH)